MELFIVHVAEVLNIIQSNALL